MTCDWCNYEGKTMHDDDVCFIMEYMDDKVLLVFKKHGVEPSQEDTEHMVGACFDLLGVKTLCDGDPKVLEGHVHWIVTLQTIT